MSARTDVEATQTQASTGITPDTLKVKLEQDPELNATSVTIEDMSGGCGQMFEAIIVSNAFKDKRSLPRQKLVNKILKQEIAAIHAWSAKCYTLEEWEKKKDERTVKAS